MKRGGLLSCGAEMRVQEMLRPFQHAVALDVVGGDRVASATTWRRLHVNVVLRLEGPALEARRRLAGRLARRGQCVLVDDLGATESLESGWGKRMATGEG